MINSRTVADRVLALAVCDGFASAVIAVPRSLPIIATLVALPLLLGPRIALRLTREHRDRPDASAEQVIVFGAGRGGQQIVRSMLSDAESGSLPVAFLDDDHDVVTGRGSATSQLS